MTDHGWVYDYKAHDTISVAPTTVRGVLSATVTGSACESQALKDQLVNLSRLVETLLLDAGYDDQLLLDACARQGIRHLVPLAKAVGTATSPARRDRACYGPLGHPFYNVVTY